jgi:hypothetical protein
MAIHASAEKPVPVARNLAELWFNNQAMVTAKRTIAKVIKLSKLRNNPAGVDPPVVAASMFGEVSMTNKKVLQQGTRLSICLIEVAI